ncbi:hypothetical protein [Winogradskyella bathintestinalis]|uniref:DUF3278 domain-containing protein n=1 Tax=Winogradskyella bathintestinalis TaxID=3035208 RepID=A0ABT7ZYW9_9FLAO|nr:hypothetical protein [Winogradskyella bathintestinalis]MDN3494205.1 hypothetical protein [Winogradskyella bathintestinalis]
MEITRKDVEKLIELRKNDTFLNHLWNVFSRDLRPAGEFGRNEIKVWNQNIWNATFYPIFKFEFNSNNHLIKISDKLNPIGKIIIGIFIIGFLYFVFPENPTEFNYIGNWPAIAFITVFASIFALFARMIYRFEKRNQLDEIFELLDMEVEEKKTEKEWSLKNSLIRLLTYPFCLFLIGLNIFLIIPNGGYLLAIGIFGFVGFYLISDLKMIFKK